MKRTGQRRRRQYLFFLALLALPLLQFAVFYVGVNLNSVLLTFRNYSYDDGYTWVGFDNIRRVLISLGDSAAMRYAIRNSLLSYGVSILGTALALVFSYFIYKKMPLAGLFRVTLFLPSVLSAVVMVLLFKYFAENAIPAIVEAVSGQTITGLLSNSKSALPTLLFYYLWVGFGPQILMYTGAMASIPESAVESAQLDGITPLKEFWYITLPLIWPTFVTFVIVGLAGLFTNQLNLYSFYGGGADASTWTIGYYIYKSATQGKLPEYPELASLGVLLTMVTLPITFGAKYLLERFGPSTD